MTKGVNSMEARWLMNRYGADGVPFFFVMDYALRDCRIYPLAELPQAQLRFSFPHHPDGGMATNREVPAAFRWEVVAESAEAYARRFDIVKRHLLRGDSFLVNLTGAMPVHTSLDLLTIYEQSNAKYKLWMKDECVCFSPETFLQIAHDRISCCPMKGTVNADSPLALNRLMDNPKEAAEHATIVDLIRNDLSMVAEEVTVERYRYAELLHTNKGKLYQTSSRITGKLPSDYRSHLGDIICSQLPAGSITGAPKRKTMDIIAAAEPFDRGFYTGVMGLWEDDTLDSAVLIRFMDLHDGQMWFKAGGGITVNSDCDREYEEMIQKVYVPIY